MKIRYAIIAIILGCWPLGLGMILAGYQADVISVYDGDTFRCNIPEFPPMFGENVPIRIRGIDCAEIKAADEVEKELAIKARDYMRLRLLNADKVILENVKMGSFSRLVADVIIDGKPINPELIGLGLAIPYDKYKPSELVQVRYIKAVDDPNSAIWQAANKREKEIQALERSDLDGNGVIDANDMNILKADMELLGK